MINARDTLSSTQAPARARLPAPRPPIFGAASYVTSVVVKFDYVKREQKTTKPKLSVNVSERACTAVANSGEFSAVTSVHGESGRRKN